MARSRDFNTFGFVWRLLFAIVLVFASFNPSEYSFYHWLRDGVNETLVYKAAIGMLLLIGWVIYLRATWNSLGAFGLILAVAFFSIAIWLLVHWGVFETTDNKIFIWFGLAVTSLVLATGMSWSHIRRRISGQYSTDEI